MNNSFVLQRDKLYKQSNTLQIDLILVHIMSEDKQTCQICGIKCTSTCTNCRKVSYCCRDHQKKDWKSHKVACFPGVIIRHPIFGRYLISSRNILEGELVLKENAIFSGPSVFGALVLCLVCYGIIEDDRSQRCDKCGWHIHKKCANDSSIHAQNECIIFQKNGIQPSSNEENIYEKILVLRGCLVKLRDKSKWSLLLELEDHKTARFKTDGASLSKKTCNFILKRCNLSSNLTETEVDHILGVIIVNAYATEDNVTTSPDFQIGCFVFSNGSMPAHSCLPNCKWTIIQGTLYLWALTDIAKGQPLTHCYAHGGCGTLERQKHLLASKFFLCGCARCLDPTEIGSYFSGIKCSCGGYLLSLEPSKLDSKWGCNKCNTSTITSAQVQRFLDALRDAHNKATATTPSTDINWRQTLKKLATHENLLLEKVHPNHFLLQEVEQDILLRISFVLLEMQKREEDREQSFVLNEEEQVVMAKREIELSRKCVGVLDLIARGMTSHRGRQLYYLQQGLGILLSHQIQLQESNPSQVDTDKLCQDVEEWKAVREKGSALLKHESPGREEYLMGQSMSSNLGKTS